MRMTNCVTLQENSKRADSTLRLNKCAVCVSAFSRLFALHHNISGIVYLRNIFSHQMIDETCLFANHKATASSLNLAHAGFCPTVTQSTSQQL